MPDLVRRLLANGAHRSVAESHGSAIVHPAQQFARVLHRVILQIVRLGPLDGVRSLDSVAPGGHTRTVWVQMGEETGQIIHDRGTPERARLEVETFRHIVIRYHVAEGGPAVLRSIEPGAAPPSFALPVPERVSRWR